jgi:hypothetical protein
MNREKDARGFEGGVDGADWALTNPPAREVVGDGDADGTEFSGLQKGREEGP